MRIVHSKIDTSLKNNCKVMFAPVAHVMFCRKRQSDVAPCGRSDVMCSAHARSAHHLAKPNITSEGHISFRDSGTHR
jgi:hypothetical protein